MDTEKLYGLIEQLKQTDSVEQLEHMCNMFCSMTDAKYYLIGITSSNSLYAPKLNLLTNYPVEWMEIYHKKNKRISDPIVEQALSKNTPIFWSDLENIGTSLSTKQRELMVQAKAHGLVNGLSIPIHSVSGNFSVFSLVVDTEGEEGKKILQDLLPFAYPFSTQLFEQYLHILASDYSALKSVELTSRERECLFWACEGKTSWEISQILEIKERTIVFHLNNATDKLGAINRQHAAVLAIKRGLIQLNI